MASDSVSPEKLARILGGLGKPTLRGVKKCPKCGVYNGTRGISCKNKLCDAVFKDKGERRKQLTVDAVKIITGSTVQIFSVRLRDKGPDYRGFVQLPLVQDMDGNPATTVDVALLEQNSKCYVDSCLRAIAGDTWAGDCCTHIRAAIQCTECAVPLTLKNSVLNALDVSNEIKQAIWLLATETTGPLVQRVTKTMMVVKCKANNKNPLGFIHFAFFSNKKKGGKMERKFQCTCRMFKYGMPMEVKRRCVHFYACICAFASDELLAQEFAYFIDLDNKTAEEEAEDASQVICTYIPAPGSDDEEGSPGAPAGDPDEGAPEPLEPVELVFSSSEENILVFPEKASLQPRLLTGPGAKRKGAPSAGSLPSLEEEEGEPAAKRMPKPAPAMASAGRKYPSNVALDELATGISFSQWLASVTERINQTMHYQFDGNPDPLVFHVPEPFFACLQLRINAGLKRKRLPNATTGFVRRDALPLGVFTKYTWHITNVIHVKHIFDTPEMPLEVTRSFVENRDHTYDLYEPPAPDTSDEMAAKAKHPIRPFELRTYLKVGHMSPNQKDPTPFTIEWIPDILPRSHIGELRIKFEYGHQRNGLIDKDKTGGNVAIAPNVLPTSSTSLINSQLITTPVEGILVEGLVESVSSEEGQGEIGTEEARLVEFQNIQLTFSEEGDSSSEGLKNLLELSQNRS